MQQKNCKSLWWSSIIALFFVIGIKAKAATSNSEISLPYPDYTSDATTPHSWHFLFAPYGWMSSVDGDVTVRKNTVHAHIPFSKILRDMDFAGEAHIEANYDRLTFMLDPTYIKLSAGVQGPIINTSLSSAMTLIDGGIFYRIASSSDTNNNQYSSFELLGGARYLGFNNELDFARAGNISDTINLFAPIVGARIKFNATPKSQFWLRGDVGGADVDNVHSTWSATAGYAYTATSHIKLGIAYRVLDMDFNTGRSAINIMYYGPMLGIGFYS